MKLHTFAATAIAMTVGLGLATAPSVTAQSIQPVTVQPVHPEAGQSGPAISDTELKTFAVAVQGVQRITDTYLPMLHKATTIEEQNRVEQAASVHMSRVVENEGMTVSRFHQILTLAWISPELADRIRWHIYQSTTLAAY